MGDICTHLQSPSNCHPERSEGSSGCLPREMLHCVQHDRDGQTGATPCGRRHFTSPSHSPSSCHPERSEGSSGCLPREMLHFVQHDSGERSGATPCDRRHFRCPPHPHPVVILNEVKDLPVACPERCFTAFSMTGLESRGRCGHHHPLTPSPTHPLTHRTPTESQPDHSRSAQTPPASTFLPPWRAGRRTRRESWHGRRRSRCRRRPTDRW